MGSSQPQTAPLALSGKRAKDKKRCLGCCCWEGPLEEVEGWRGKKNETSAVLPGSGCPGHEDLPSKKQFRLGMRGWYCPFDTPQGRLGGRSRAGPWDTDKSVWSALKVLPREPSKQGTKWPPSESQHNWGSTEGCGKVPSKR